VLPPDYPQPCLPCALSPARISTECHFRRASLHASGSVSSSSQAQAPAPRPLRQRAFFLRTTEEPSFWLGTCGGFGSVCTVNALKGKSSSLSLSLSLKVFCWCWCRYFCCCYYFTDRSCERAVLTAVPICLISTHSRLTYSIVIVIFIFIFIYYIHSYIPSTISPFHCHRSPSQP